MSVLEGNDYDLRLEYAKEDRVWKAIQSSASDISVLEWEGLRSFDEHHARLNGLINQLVTQAEPLLFLPFKCVGDFALGDQTPPDWHAHGRTADLDRSRCKTASHATSSSWFSSMSRMRASSNSFCASVSGRDSHDRRANFPKCAT